MDSAWLRVTVVYCEPCCEDSRELKMPAGSTVRDAIAAAELLTRRPELKDAIDAGVWGQRCSIDRPLVHGDRVEIYRPLTIDPKEGRRVRADLRRKRAVKS